MCQAIILHTKNCYTNILLCSICPKLCSKLHRYTRQIIPWKVCICHFTEWQIHPLISKGTICMGVSVQENYMYGCVSTREQNPWACLYKRTTCIGVSVQDNQCMGVSVQENHMYVHRVKKDRVAAPPKTFRRWYLHMGHKTIVFQCEVGREDLWSAGLPPQCPAKIAANLAKIFWLGHNSTRVAKRSASQT